MAYSSIIKNLCKCGCNKYPTLGYQGYNIDCRPDLKEKKIKEQAERQKARNSVSRTQSSLRKLMREDEGVREGAKDIDKLERWFMERRREMTGVCTECGKTTSKNNDKYFKWSICHIVPKSLIPSVAINEFNWIELCQQHHQEFDNTFDKAAAMMCFGEVKMKFQLFKKLIPPEELRKINPHLID